MCICATCVSVYSTEFPFISLLQLLANIFNLSSFLAAFSFTEKRKASIRSGLSCQTQRNQSAMFFFQSGLNFSPNVCVYIARKRTVAVYFKREREREKGASEETKRYEALMRRINRIKRKKNRKKEPSRRTDRCIKGANAYLNYPGHVKSNKARGYERCALHKRADLNNILFSYLCIIYNEFYN